MHLLDNSIQIKRLLSPRWRQNNLDSFWERVTPITSLYGLMEFKNTVIRAIAYLVDVLAQTAPPSGEPATYRLKEVILLLNMDSQLRERDRVVRIANAFAAQILEESSLYARDRTVEEIVFQLQLEAEMFENVWFFQYSVKGEPRKMDFVNRVECHLGMHLSPSGRARREFSCTRETVSCKMCWFLENSRAMETANAISNGTLSVKDKNLKDGVSALIAYMAKRGDIGHVSIGQQICMRIGDLVYVAKAHSVDAGIVTADKDQVRMAKFLGVSVYYYDGGVNSIVDMTKRDE